MPPVTVKTARVAGRSWIWVLALAPLHAALACGHVDPEAAARDREGGVADGAEREHGGGASDGAEGGAMDGGGAGAMDGAEGGASDGAEGSTAAVRTCDFRSYQAKGAAQDHIFSRLPLGGLGVNPQGAFNIA